MKKWLLISSGAITLISVTALCTVLIMGGIENPSHPPVSESGGGTTTAFADGYWAQKLSRLEAENSTASTTSTTTTTTTTTEKQTAFTTVKKTTTEQSRMTTYTRRNETATERTTTVTAAKTTRTLTQAERDMVYSGIYDIVMEQFNRDRTVLLEYITKLDGQIAEQEKAKEALYAQYKEESAKYSTESAKTALYNAYQNSVASIEKAISELESEKRSTQSTLEQKEKELDSVIQAKYYEAVEELQQSTLS